MLLGVCQGKDTKVCTDAPGVQVSIPHGLGETTTNAVHLFGGSRIGNSDLIRSDADEWTILFMKSMNVKDPSTTQDRKLQRPIDHPCVPWAWYTG